MGRARMGGRNTCREKRGVSTMDVLVERTAEDEQCPSVA